MARIEKVLQGSITHCAEPYMKSSDSSKVRYLLLWCVKSAEVGQVDFTSVNINQKLSSFLGNSDNWMI